MWGQCCRFRQNVLPEDGPVWPKYVARNRIYCKDILRTFIWHFSELNLNLVLSKIKSVLHYRRKREHKWCQMLDTFAYSLRYAVNISMPVCHLLSLKFLAWLILQPWRWRRHVPPKCQLTFRWTMYCCIPEEGTLSNISSRFTLMVSTFLLQVCTIVGDIFCRRTNVN
jgi:hypothetical protein